MKVKVEDFINQCGCRSVGECTHDDYAENKALDALVFRFADAMKIRLLEKQVEGWHGWDDEALDVEKIRDRIYNNISGPLGSEKAIDIVDVANLAAFWWNRFDEEES